MCYDLSVASAVKQPTGSDIIYAANFGVNSFSDLVLFYKTWELNGHYQSNVSTEQNRTYFNMVIIVVNSCTLSCIRAFFMTSHI